MTTPSITAAQVTAFLTWAMSLVAAFGFSLTSAQQTAIVGGSAFIAAALVAADAVIRHGRSRALAPAASSTPSVPASTATAAVPAPPATS